MCGIVGIVSLDPRVGVDTARVVAMRDALRHRGPDGEGLFVEGPVGLGHRRLAIVDVAGGQQPMANEDGSCWIVYNGEVYNHMQLRPGLEAAGHRYATRSDTETILHLYEEEQERSVERLSGMFAFAIWDRRRRRLLLARDRLGIKPLYYALTGTQLVFASEIKAILASGLVKPELEQSLLPELLATRFVSGSATLFRGIRRLPPAHTLAWSAEGGLEPRQYWRLPEPAEETPASLEERAAGVRDRLTAAVRSHLMSDVPLGVFLSGGIDSSGLLGLMAPMVAPEPVRTFSVGFSDREANELDYARQAAWLARAEHREIVVTPAAFLRALPRLVWHEDEPIAFPSSVPLYFVSELARQHVKVVLTGEGADELFLGYNRYRVTAWNDRLGRGYARLVPGGVRQAVRDGVLGLPRRLRRYASRSFLGMAPGPRSLFFENFAVFPERLQSDLLADPTLLAARDPYHEPLAAFLDAGGGMLDRMSRADLQTYLVRLLMKQDTMSMAASVESRVPFLDHQLVEHVVSMPSRFKLRGLTTKAVLRSAFTGVVPRVILTRRKMGFPVPLDRWFRGPFAFLLSEFVAGPRALERGLLRPEAVQRLVQEHRSGRANHGDRLWLLLNLEIWHRVFVEGEDAADLLRAA